MDKKVITYHPGPTDSFPALRLAFAELVQKYNDLVRAFNEVVEKLESRGEL